jgi:hypothetical protein
VFNLGKNDSISRFRRILREQHGGIILNKNDFTENDFAAALEAAIILFFLSDTEVPTAVEFRLSN